MISKTEMKNERKSKMNLDKATLMRFESRGEKVGTWHGKSVFACSSVNLESKGSGAYYILYDDENRIVARTNNGWKSFGEVTSQGSVNEYSSARNYKTPAEAAAAARRASTSGMRSAATLQSEPIPQAVMTVSYASETSYTPGYDRVERPVGDVKVGLDVEGTLRKAREMTVESLLEGFLPGVDFSVAKG